LRDSGIQGLKDSGIEVPGTGILGASRALAEAFPKTDSERGELTARSDGSMPALETRTGWAPTARLGVHRSADAIADGGCIPCVWTHPVRPMLDPLGRHEP